MDLKIVGAVALLVIWAVLVLTTDAAGWVHMLLTGGMFLLIWAIVVRGTPAGSGAGSVPSSGNSDADKRKP